MKKLLLLFFALLTGVSGAWAETLTLVTAADTWSGGTFYTSSGANSTVGTWGHSYLSAASTTQPQVFINSDKSTTSNGFNCGNGRHGNGKTFYLNIQPGYKITGYSISFKSVGSTTTITAADGKTSKTADGTTAQTLSVTGLSTLNTSYSVSGGNNAIITGFTITYEAVDGAKYRMNQRWNNTTDYYTYGKSDDLTYMYETNSATGITLLTNSYYMWAAHSNNCKLLLQNVGTTRYVGTFTKTTSNVAYALMTSENAAGAENLRLVCNYNYGNYYTLQGISNSAYIDSYGSANNSDVRVHNNLHQGDIFKFIPVKTVNFVNTSSEAQAITVTASDAPSGSYSTIYVAMDGSDSFTLSGSYKYSFDNGDNYVLASEAATTIASAGTSDMTVMVKENTSVAVTYQVVYGGAALGGVTATADVNRGDDYSIPSSLVRAFCTYTYYSDAECTDEIETLDVSYLGSTQTVYAKATYSGPFTFSTDYASAKWYYMTLNSLYVASNGADANPTLSAEMTAGDAGQWAFLGNPYDGVQVINKALEGYYLQDTSSKPKMTTTSTNWELQKHNDKFMLWSSTRGYFDAYEGNLGYYGEIYGSCEDCSVTEVPDNYYSYFAANVTPFFTSGSGYFYLDSEKSGYSAVKAIYDAAVASETCSEANYNTLVSYFETLDNYILPSTGYYRLKNYLYPTYYMNAETTSPNGITSNTTAGTVVYLTKAGNTYTMQMQGSYLQTPSKSTQVGLSGSSVTFTPTVGKAGWASFNAGGGYYGSVHMKADKTIVGWCADGIETNNASYWELEDAETVAIPLHEVDSKYYGTMYLPFDVTLPTPTAGNGVVACRVSISGNRAQLTSMPYNRDIPAGMPVLLYGEGCGTSINVTITSSVAAIDGDNDLEGTYFDKTSLDDAEYIFGTKDGELGFWKLGTGHKVGANKAYLVYNGDPSEVKGFTLDFDEIETGIREVNGEGLRVKNEMIFNLAGQRVSKAQKGLYIIGGKKILVK